MTNDDAHILLGEAQQRIKKLEDDLADTENKRALAQGKADNYLLELQRVRDARAKGRRANRTLRQKLTELEARLYRLTNRGDVYDKVGRQYGLSGSKTSRIRSNAQA